MCILSSVNTEGVCLQWPGEQSTEGTKAPYVAVTTNHVMVWFWIWHSDHSVDYYL